MIEALCNILKNCRAPRYKIVTLQRRSTKERRLTPPTDAGAVEAAVEAEEVVPTGAGAETGTGIEAAAVAVASAVGGAGETESDAAATLENRLGMLELTPDQFHERLHTLHFKHIGDVARYYMENYQQLSKTYGVLLFMYSVFLTKGTEKVTSDISDTSEPLIHSTYGYGAQSLINLMLTGRAVAHVWDNEQDVGGLKLRGICEQSDIGFITLMEQMRYCTVGSFFKNPRYPVWVMGSDTHLTGASFNSNSCQLFNVMIHFLYLPPCVFVFQFCLATKRGSSRQRHHRRRDAVSSSHMIRRAITLYRVRCCGMCWPH